MSILSLFGCGPSKAPEYPSDQLTARDGTRFTITFFKHASLSISAGGKYIYVDPVGANADYAALPKADIVLITGPLTTRVRDRVLAVWNELPEPKITEAVGICPISGGVFREGYSIEGPISRYIPVDVNVPGCPPRPQAILEGVVLARKMWLKKLGIEE